MRGYIVGLTFRRLASCWSSSSWSCNSVILLSNALSGHSLSIAKLGYEMKVGRGHTLKARVVYYNYTVLQ